MMQDVIGRFAPAAVVVAPGGGVGPCFDVNSPEAPLPDAPILHGLRA